jgi:hypothetical protein
MSAMDENQASTSATRALFSIESTMAAIVKRLNTIADNPLCRKEAAELERAYKTAVVRYFDGCRAAACAKSEYELRIPGHHTIRD